MRLGYHETAMRRPPHRAMSWTLLATLTVGLLGAASSVESGSLGCCARGSGPEAMQRCQWMIPAACCDESLSVAGSDLVPKPLATTRLRAPLDPWVETPVLAPGYVSTSRQRVDLNTIVLRL